MRARGPRTRELAKASSSKYLGQLEGCSYIVQHKEYLGLDPSTVSSVGVSEGLGTTCSREVAVSVRTPPKAPRWTEIAFLEDRREETGRASRGIDRANTMMNQNEISIVLEE